MYILSMRTRIMTAGLIIGLLGSGAAPAVAETISVDPGVKVSAGMPITGSGQNLPTLDSSTPWNNGSLAAAQVNNYYLSGGAAQDQKDVAGDALKWTRTWLTEQCGGLKLKQIRDCKAVAVFDIDDTLVSSYPIASSNDPAFGYNPTVWKNAEANCLSPAIDTTQKLYHQFKKLGMALVLITGRSVSNRDETVFCLRSQGVSGWKKLVMRPVGDSGSAALYKFKARRVLEKKGWNIGPSIGDQLSDMSFGALKHGFLVPNVMYFIP